MSLTMLAADEPSAFSPPAVFAVSPLPLDKIIPLGNLNPRGGHVFPTDHIYLDYGGQAGMSVAAPAAGTVFAIRSQSVGDFKIEIRVDHFLCYYLAHLDVEPRIQVGSQVKAGQVIGRASARSWLDLGAYDSRIRLKGFIHAARYPSSTLQSISPLALFAEPLKSQLAVMAVREGADKNGKIDFDQPGRLVGNWFRKYGRNSSRSYTTCGNPKRCGFPLAERWPPPEFMRCQPERPIRQPWRCARVW